MCEHGPEPVDAVPFDLDYDCDCGASIYEGDNCEQEFKCAENQKQEGKDCSRFEVAISKSRNMPTDAGADGLDYIDPASTAIVEIGKTFRIAPYELLKAGTTVTSGEFEDISFSLKAGHPSGFFINSADGTVQAQFVAADDNTTYSITVVATDKTGLTAEVDTFSLTAQWRDTDPANPPPDRATRGPRAGWPGDAGWRGGRAPPGRATLAGARGCRSTGRRLFHADLR